MFNKDFYPTPENIISLMMQDEQIQDKVFLEPSAGKGDIVSYLLERNAKSVIACENNEELQKILKTKCNIIESDFLSLTSDKISHINYIVMNPPFTADETHILHAYNIAPEGCKIISLCNYATIQNPYTATRKQLVYIISQHGTIKELGDCFTDAERKTGVNIGFIKLQKPGEKQESEFNGFFMEEDEEEAQENALMSYNVVKDLVHRYVSAVKVYKELLSVESRLSEITNSFFGSGIGLKVELSYEQYKKALQKSGWLFILNKMNLTKYTTRGVREDINKFVEEQTNIPFTMKNIYHMLDIVIQTAGQRMDKAILEAFDRVTSHHHDNRHNVKGWKTNSHFLVGKKFILPNQINPATRYGYTDTYYTSLTQSYDGTIPDFEKALCYVTGEKYEEDSWENGKKVNLGINTVNSSINRNEYGEWFESHFFKYKGYKNGNMHYEFKNDKVWELFNKKVAELKGFPLFESKKQTAYQEKQTGRDKKTKSSYKTAKEPIILQTIKF